MSKDRKGIDLLRYAVNLFNRCSETFNQEYSIEELLKIAEAQQKIDWDFYPDQFSSRQISELLKDGKIPQWRSGESWERKECVAVYSDSLSVEELKKIHDAEDIDYPDIQKIFVRCPYCRSATMLYITGTCCSDCDPVMKQFRKDNG